MNAANERYPAKEIPEPKGMQKVEICIRSGLLATDKCYDAVKSASGDTVRKRTTYVELATSVQMPTEPCNVHGEMRTRLVRDLPASGFPRASLAVDPKQVQPITPQGPVLLAANDPYNAVHSTVKPKPVEKTEVEKSSGTDEQSKLPDPTKPVLKAEAVQPDETKPAPKAEAVETPSQKPVLKAERVEPESTKPILRAEPVTPTPQKSPKEIRRAEPVHPSDEIPPESILRPTPPPASNPDE
jgi:hypothetical protein